MNLNVLSSSRTMVAVVVVRVGMVVLAVAVLFVAARMDLLSFGRCRWQTHSTTPDHAATIDHNSEPQN